MEGEEEEEAAAMEEEGREEEREEEAEEDAPPPPPPRGHGSRLVGTAASGGTGGTGGGVPLSSSAASNIFSAFSRRGGGGEGGLLSAARVAGSRSQRRGWSSSAATRSAPRRSPRVRDSSARPCAGCGRRRRRSSSRRRRRTSTQGAAAAGASTRFRRGAPRRSSTTVVPRPLLRHARRLRGRPAAAQTELPRRSPVGCGRRRRRQASAAERARVGAARPASHRAPLGGALLESLHRAAPRGERPRLFEGWRVALRPGCAAVTNSWATPLSEAQITALFASGGASVLSPGADVDVIFVGESSDVGSSAPRGASRAARCAVVQVPCGPDHPGQLRADALGGATAARARRRRRHRCAGSAAGVPTRGGRRDPLPPPAAPPCRYHSPPRPLLSRLRLDRLRRTRAPPASGARDTALPLPQQRPRPSGSARDETVRAHRTTYTDREAACTPRWAAASAVSSLRDVYFITRPVTRARRASRTAEDAPHKAHESSE